MGRAQDCEMAMQAHERIIKSGPDKDIPKVPRSPSTCTAFSLAPC